MLSWASQENRRLETVRVVLTDRGLRANGYLIDTTAVQYGASYSMFTDARGRTRRLTVQSDSLDGERHLTLTRTPGGPWLVESTAGSKPLYALNEAVDIDMDASAFSNTLPMRRLQLPSPEPPSTDDTARNQAVENRTAEREFRVIVACVSLPTLAVRAVEHHYRFLQSGLVHYRGPAGEADFTVDDDYFVLELPGVSRRLG